MTDHVTKEKLYRLSRVADDADLSLRTVQKHVREGHLPVVKVGPYARPRVRESDYRRYLGEKADDSKTG